MSLDSESAFGIALDHGGEMQKVSLKFLASELGLAEGTVSRALNGYPDISAATRERVQTFAKKHN